MTCGGIGNLGLCRQERFVVGKENLYPQDAELNGASGTRTRPGWRSGQRRRPRSCPLNRRGAGQPPGRDQARQAAGRGVRHRHGLRLRGVLRVPADAAVPAQTSAESSWPDHLRRSRKCHTTRKRTAELAALADLPLAPRHPGDVLTALFGPPRPGRKRHPGSPRAGSAGKDGARVRPRSSPHIAAVCKPSPQPLSCADQRC